MAEAPVDIHADTVVTRNPRTAARTVEGRSLVVVIDRNELHTLNATGSFLWEQCEGKSVGELAALLVAQYGIDSAQANHDATAFVRSLVGVGALLPGGA